MLLFLQLLTNSLDTCVNCISDVYEFPVTTYNKRKGKKMLQFLIQASLGNKAIKVPVCLSYVYILECRNNFALLFVLTCRLVSLITGTLCYLVYFLYYCCCNLVESEHSINNSSDGKY